MNMKSNDLPILFFGDQESLENWLGVNHDTSPGIWLQIAKKNSDVISVSYSEAVESALCYGWIDSQILKFDKKMYLQRFTPRKAKSNWSKINKEKAELLISNGRMKPSGFKAIELAIQNGSWENADELPSSPSLPGR